VKSNSKQHEMVEVEMYEVKEMMMQKMIRFVCRKRNRENPITSRQIWNHRGASCHQQTFSALHTQLMTKFSTNI